MFQSFTSQQVSPPTLSILQSSTQQLISTFRKTLQPKLTHKFFTNTTPSRSFSTQSITSYTPHYNQTTTTLQFYQPSISKSQFTPHHKSRSKTTRISLSSQSFRSTSKHYFSNPTTKSYSSLFTPKSHFIQTKRHLHHVFRRSQSTFLFQQGLGKAHQSRSRLGAVPKAEAAKVPDPLGLEAKQKRLESQLKSLKEGKEMDPFEGLTPEQRQQQIEYLQRMKTFEKHMAWTEFILGQSATYHLFWSLLLCGGFGLTWFGVSYFLDYNREDDMSILKQSHNLSTALKSGTSPTSKEANRKLLEQQASAAEISKQIAKFSSPNFVAEFEKKTHGRVEGSFNGHLDQLQLLPWKSRIHIATQFVNSGQSYADYAGDGHFYIFHNGRDQIPDILKKIQKDNLGMGFTYQILSPMEEYLLLNNQNFTPRTVEQLKQDEKAGIDSTQNTTITGKALHALDKSQEQLQLLTKDKKDDKLTQE